MRHTYPRTHRRRAALRQFRTCPCSPRATGCARHRWSTPRSRTGLRTQCFPAVPRKSRRRPEWAQAERAERVMVRRLWAQAERAERVMVRRCRKSMHRIDLPCCQAHNVDPDSSPAHSRTSTTTRMDPGRRSNCHREMPCCRAGNVDPHSFLRESRTRTNFGTKHWMSGCDENSAGRPRTGPSAQRGARNPASLLSSELWY